MTKCLSFLSPLVLLAVLNSAFSQNSDGPFPKSPILHRAPALASWTIQLKYKDEEKPVASKEVSLFIGDRIRSIVVTKTNKTYHEEVTTTSGKTYEKWTLDGIQLETLPGRSTIVTVAPPTPEEPSPDYTDYRKSDFEDFLWTSLGNYKGTSDWQGKQIYQFDANGKRAALSTESQLPIYLITLDVSKTYTYNPPPAVPLIPPKDFLEAIATHKRGLESLKYHPSPP